MISTISKLFRLLSSDIEPNQLSMGITLGLIAGLSPVLSLQSILVLILLISLRVNLSIFVISLGLISLVAFLADAVLITIGHSVLTMPELSVIFTDMYNTGLWRFLNFNNTVAMGSLLVSIIAAIPCYLLSHYLIVKYRSSVVEKWKRSAIFKYMQNSKLIGKVAAISDKVS